MDEFEELLQKEQLAVEQFVRFKVNNKVDEEDILPEVYLTAYQKYSQLKNKESFKAWIISIACNKCNDYFRMKAKFWEIPIEELREVELCDSRYGISEVYTIKDILERLGEKDKQILYL